MKIHICTPRYLRKYLGRQDEEIYLALSQFLLMPKAHGISGGEMLGETLSVQGRSCRVRPERTSLNSAHHSSVLLAMRNSLTLMFKLYKNSKWFLSSMHSSSHVRHRLHTHTRIKRRRRPRLEESHDCYSKNAGGELNVSVRYVRSAWAVEWTRRSD